MSDSDWDSDMRRMQAETNLIIRDLVIRQMRLEHAALEEMVERMLTSPIPAGIAVIIMHETEGGIEDGYFVHESRNYRLDPHVPFGHVFEFPSMESYELWVERGWPL